MKQYTLVYVDAYGNTVGRDYFDNLEDAYVFIDNIIKTYKHYNENKGLILYDDDGAMIRYYEPENCNDVTDEEDEEYIIKVVCPHCEHEFELNRLEHDEINLEGFYTGCMKCGGSFDIDFDMSLTFITDIPKMADFKILTKEEFLFSYSYLTEAEYEATRLYYNWLMADDREP